MAARKNDEKKVKKGRNEVTMNQSSGQSGG